MITYNTWKEQVIKAFMEHDSAGSTPTTTEDEVRRTWADNEDVFKEIYEKIPKLKKWHESNNQPYDLSVESAVHWLYMYL